MVEWIRIWEHAKKMTERTTKKSGPRREYEAPRLQRELSPEKRGFLLAEVARDDDTARRN